MTDIYNLLCEKCGNRFNTREYTTTCTECSRLTNPVAEGSPLRLAPYTILDSNKLGHIEVIRKKCKKCKKYKKKIAQLEEIIAKLDKRIIDLDNRLNKNMKYRSTWNDPLAQISNPYYVDSQEVK